MHNHPSDRTYYVITGRGIMRGPDQKEELTPGKVIKIPAMPVVETWAVKKSGTVESNSGFAVARTPCHPPHLTTTDRAAGS